MRNSLKLLAIACFFSFNGSAQTTSSNHLLWRISGNGLSKPSYLFGTMHLTDKRLFYFGDSLYRALEQTEGFAAEVDFNAFLTKYLEKMIGDKQKASALVKDKINPAVLSKNKSQLEKKFGKPVDEITMADLKDMESERNTGRLKSGEMETFMDAYLLGLADKQGKWIGGIEDPEDQLGLDTAFTTESRISSFLDNNSGGESIEWMIQTYLNEKLETIDRSSNLWKGAKDIILIRRNIKMAYRVDSLAHVRSCLFAVGAAHLPGDSGVVKLLREKGFTITPVISSKKIDPSKYKFKEVEKVWVDVWPKDSLYSMEMPAVPMSMSELTDVPVDMLIHYDLVSTTVFFTASTSLAGAGQKMKDSALVNLVKYYKKSSTDFEEKDIVINGRPGKEFLMQAKGGLFRMQVAVFDNYVLLNMIGGVKKEALFSKNANRFLASYKPDTARAAHVARLRAKGWKTYEYPDDGFSIQSPIKLKRKTADIGENNAWKRYTYEGPDAGGHVYYMIMIDEIQPGYFPDDDANFFKGTEEMIEKSSGKLLSSRHITHGDAPAFEIMFKPDEADNSYVTKLVLLNKSSRRFMLLKTFDSTAQKSSMDDQFFQSFRALQPSLVQWKTVTTDAGFTTFSPQQIFRADTSSGGDISYVAYDSLAAVSFSVLKEVFPSYYWAKNDTDLFHNKIRTFLGEDDSLVEQTFVKNGRSTGVDLLIQLHGSSLFKKMRLVLSGDSLYTLYSFLPKDQLNITGFKRFFEDFRPVNDGGVSTIFTNKPEDLLAKLLVADSAVFHEAKTAIAEAPFTPADIPLLQQAMLYMYHDLDSTTQYVSATANAAISERLIELDSLGVNIDFVRKHYSTLTGMNEHLKFFMLDMLSAKQTSASYTFLNSLLTEPLPATEAYFYLSGLRDSLPLSRELFPNAFIAMDHPALMEQLSDLTLALHDSGYIDTKMIRDHERQLLRLAAKPLSFDKGKLESDGYEYFSVIELITRLKSIEANAVLHKLAGMNYIDVSQAAVFGLLRNNQKLTTQEVLPLAKSDEYRNMLYDSLEKYGRMAAFPQEYRTQRWLAQSTIFSYGYADEEKPVVSFIKEKIVDFNGQKKKFYLYKLSYSEDGESKYLGVAGPYSLNAKDLKTDNSATGIYWKEEYDPKNIETQFNEFLKQRAALAEEEDQ